MRRGNFHEHLITPHNCESATLHGNEKKQQSRLPQGKTVGWHPKGLLLFVTILSQTLLTLMSSDFMTFSFFTTRHNLVFFVNQL
jgi:hypothetical protein